MHLVSSSNFNRTHNLKAEHGGAVVGTRPRDFPAAFILRTISPTPSVLLLVICGFLMSPFKICLMFLFFLHTLQAVNMCRNFWGKKIVQLQLMLLENNASDISRFSKGKAFLLNRRNCSKVRTLWPEVEKLLHMERTALSRLNSENLR